MNRSLISRLLAAACAAAVALSLSGCVTDNASSKLPSRARAPLKPSTLALLEKKGMTKSSPIVVRLYKQESELEIWKPNSEGRFEVFKTYPICRWSGELGPKIKEGDRQAPEGFYTIVPGLMNPRSSYYLAFNTGFPNAFDRAHGRTGGDLMVHGDCSSRGCYAMTDEQIAEIYALGRESFEGGQRSFQVQAYPFRMTPENLARHRNNPNIAFWRMLKEGNDHFLVSRKSLKVDVCDKRYVFNATPTGDGRFDPSGPCPAYEVPSDVAKAVEDKRTADDAKVAALVAGGVQAAPVKMGTDGATHPVFLAGKTGIGDPSGADVVRTETYRPSGSAALVQTAESASSASSGSWFGRLFAASAPETTASTGAAATPAAKPSNATVATPPARPASATVPAKPASAPAPSAPASGGYALASAGGRPASPPAGPAARPAGQASAGQASAGPATPAQRPATIAAAVPAAPGSLIGGAAPVLAAGSFGN